MKIMRWRLWMLMVLVLAVGVGIKVALFVRARAEAIKLRDSLLFAFNPPLRTAEVEARLVALLSDPDPQIRSQACGMLARYGATAPGMVPILIRQLETETFESAFTSRRDPGRIDPAEALKRFRFPPAVIAPRLVAAMKGQDWFIRSQALAVLTDAAGQPGPPDPTLTTLLLTALDDGNPRNRLQAIDGLVRLDRDARGRAVAALLGQLRDPPDCWALLAVVGLSRFDPEGRSAAPVLAGRLGVGSLEARYANLYLLGRLGPLAESAVPAIVRSMTAPDAREYWPPFSLGELNPHQDAGHSWINIGVLPATDTAEYPSTLSAMAVRVLGRIGPEAGAAAVARLIEVVRDGGGDEARRLAAARALGDLGPRAAPAFPDLLALVERTTVAPSERRGDWIMAGALTRTLRQVVAGDDPRLVAALIRLLGSDAPAQRFDAALVLGELDPPAPAAIAALVWAAKHEGQGIRHSAALALGRYAGPERAAVVPALLEAVRDPDEFVRFEAANSLARLRAGAPEVVPAAIEWLGSNNLVYRRGAAKILGDFGPAARSALPALLGVRSDPDVFVREAVEEALRLIGPTGADPPR